MRKPSAAGTGATVVSSCFHEVTTPTASWNHESSVGTTPAIVVCGTASAGPNRKYASIVSPATTRRPQCRHAASAAISIPRMAPAAAAARYRGRRSRPEPRDRHGQQQRGRREVCDPAPAGQRLAVMRAPSAGRRELLELADRHDVGIADPAERR